MTLNEKVIEKIAKLRAHAESAAKIGNEAEAEAFATMMQRLLLKHKLSMTDLDYKTFEKEEPVEERWVDYAKHGLDVKAARSLWVERLVYIITKAHFCRFLVYQGSSRISIIGRASDAAIAEYMYITLYRHIDKLGDKGKIAYRKHCRATGEVQQPYFKAGFVQAFVARLAERYEAELNAQTGASSTALVRINKAESAVSDWMKAQEFKKSKALARPKYNAEGARRGREEAEKVNLRAKAVTGTTPHAELS